MISKRNKTQFILDVRTKLRRREQQYKFKNVQDAAAFAGCVLLHSCVVVDELADVVCEDLRQAWFSVLDLEPIAYLEFFERIKNSLLEHCRTNGRSPVLTGATKDERSKVGRFSAILKSVFPIRISDAETFRSLYQIAAFPLRLTLSETGKADYDKFLEINSSREKYVPSELSIWIAKEIVDDEFCANVRERYHPHHGPGSVSYLVDDHDALHLTSSRMDFREKDRLIDKVAIDEFESDVLGYGPLLSAQAFQDRGYHRYRAIPVAERPVRVVSVPKDWKKRRLIAIENATQMYLQEGIKTGLCYAIRKSAFGRFIDFEHAEYNGYLAELGSLYRVYDTLDLSSASDTVGYAFVKGLFQETPLWRILEGIRPRCFQVQEQLVDSHIFATMGNAVCFPIETLVFAILVETARRELDCTEPFRVYGDDIVVPSSITSRVREILTESGFLLNVDKSFWGESPFRESCGYEAYGGVGVTPLRISRRFSGLNKMDNLEQLLALIDLANLAHVRHMTLYRFLVRYLVTELGLKIPFSDLGDVGLISNDPDSHNSDLPWHINMSLQREEFEVDRIVSVVKRRRRDQTLAYREWLSSNQFRDTVERPSIVSTACSAAQPFLTSTRICVDEV